MTTTQAKDANKRASRLQKAAKQLHMLGSLRQILYLVLHSDTICKPWNENNPDPVLIFSWSKRCSIAVGSVFAAWKGFILLPLLRQARSALLPKILVERCEEGLFKKGNTESSCHLRAIAPSVLTPINEDKGARLLGVKSRKADLLEKRAHKCYLVMKSGENAPYCNTTQGSDGPGPLVFDL